MTLPARPEYAERLEAEDAQGRMALYGWHAVGDPNMTLWLVRAGRNGEREQLALDQNLAVIGWDELPDLGQLQDRTELAALLEEIHPDRSAKTRSNWESQIWPFVRVMAEGDLVALPLKTRPSIALGKVMGSYRHRTDLPGVFHTRPVRWIAERPRSEFDQDLLYSLGAFMTVCRIRRNHAEARVAAMMEGKAPPSAALEDADEARSDLEAAPDLELYARDQIRDFISRRYRGHRLTELVAELLAAQGYQVRVSPEGPDGGVDILAGRGPLGFERPRLAVQVKSGEGAADVKVLRELQGVMRNFGADQGLFVSWAGYRGSVPKEAARLFFEIRLWDSDTLVRELQAHYDALPDTVQAELPLKRVWTLVQSDETDG